MVVVVVLVVVEDEDEVVELVEVGKGAAVVVVTVLVIDGIVTTAEVAGDIGVVVAVRYPSSDLSKSINS